MKSETRQGLVTTFFLSNPDIYCWQEFWNVTEMSECFTFETDFEIFQIHFFFVKCININYSFIFIINYISNNYVTQFCHRFNSFSNISLRNVDDSWFCNCAASISRNQFQENWNWFENKKAMCLSFLIIMLTCFARRTRTKEWFIQIPNHQISSSHLEHASPESAKYKLMFKVKRLNLSNFHGIHICTMYIQSNS